MIIFYLLLFLVLQEVVHKYYQRSSLHTKPQQFPQLPDPKYQKVEPYFDDVLKRRIVKQKQ